jgi:hypothetical protein
MRLGGWLLGGNLDQVRGGRVQEWKQELARASIFCVLTADELGELGEILKTQKALNFCNRLVGLWVHHQFFEWNVLDLRGSQILPQLDLKQARQRINTG